MTTTTQKPPLKLIARDTEDVAVLAAVLQDAIAPVSDMIYRAADKNFIMVVHRFRWDCAEAGQAAPPKPDCCFERICCAVNVQGVISVQLQGFAQGEQGRMLDLLTVIEEDGSLQFIFAGDARIKLTLEKLHLFLEDFGEAWPTQRQPCHVT
jgi:hypothetical protein